MGTHDYPPIERVLQCFTYRDGELFWNNRPLDHFAEFWDPSVYAVIADSLADRDDEVALGVASLGDGE